MKLVTATLLAAAAVAGTADAATVRVDLVDVRFARSTGSGAPDGTIYAVTGSLVAETNPAFGPGSSPFLFDAPSDFTLRGLSRIYTPENATGQQLFTPPEPDPQATGLGALQLDPEAVNPETGNPSVDSVALELLFDVAAAEALRTARVGEAVSLTLVSGREGGTRFEPIEEDSFAVFVGQSIPGRDDVVTATVVEADVAPIPLPAGGWLLVAGLAPLGWMAMRRRA